MDRLERIAAMEEKLNSSLEAVRALDRALEDYRAVRGGIRALADYLSGDDWRADYAADEAGLLPADLPRGVLSEDGIYALLEEDDELRQAIRALAEET